MKTLKYVFSALLIFAALQIASCGGNNSPAARYADLVGKIVDEMEKCNSVDELYQISQTSEYGKEANAIVNENPDYVLTDSDKEKLIKVNDRLAQVFFDKTVQLGAVPEEVKKYAEDQMKASIEAINDQINNCKTLGDLGGF